MRRGHSKTRFGPSRQGVLSLFLLAAIAVQPLNLSGSCAACKAGSAAPQHDCCPKPEGAASASRPSCCLTLCAQNRNPNYLVNPRDASSSPELRPTGARTVVPALSVSFNRTNPHFFSQDISPPVNPLHQSCLLRI